MTHFEVKTYKRNDDELYRGLVIGWVMAVITTTLCVWVWGTFKIGMEASGNHWIALIIIIMFAFQIILGIMIISKLFQYLISNRFRITNPDDNTLRTYLAKIRTKNTTGDNE